jgi:hypothetical protein
MKQLLLNIVDRFKSESRPMKAVMIGVTLVFGIVVGASIVQTQADDSNDTFNGAHLQSPIEGTTLDRVDDGDVSCYYFMNQDGSVQQSCVVRDTDRGSDEK